MVEFGVFCGVCVGLIGWLIWYENHGDSESAREIKAILRRQRKEALKARRKYPHTMAGARY